MSEIDRPGGRPRAGAGGADDWGVDWEADWGADGEPAADGELASEGAPAPDGELAADAEPGPAERAPEEPEHEPALTLPPPSRGRAQVTRRAGPARRAARPGRRTRRGQRLFTRAFSLLVLALAALIVFLIVEIVAPGGGGHRAVSVTIPRRVSSHRIGVILEDKGVVDSAEIFALRARLDGGTLKPGTYTLRQSTSYATALNALEQGPARAPQRFVNVTIPEGFTRAQTARLAKRDGLRGSYLAASRRSPQLNSRRYGAPRGTPDLEGFLFPATYQLDAHAAARTLVDKQLAAFKQRLATLGLRYARGRQLTAYDVVTIASLIEREARVARDRPLIAAVIYNRLHDHMDLQIDATVRFGTGNETRPLTQSQLKSSSPYNTYTHSGLPPTPIANPGLASLQAAAHPAKVGYLYYVLRPCAGGRHAFSSTFAQFKANEARLESAPARCRR